jgi:hypothetical protein
MKRVAALLLVLATLAGCKATPAPTTAPGQVATQVAHDVAATLTAMVVPTQAPPLLKVGVAETSTPLPGATPALPPTSTAMVASAPPPGTTSALPPTSTAMVATAPPPGETATPAIANTAPPPPAAPATCANPAKGQIGFKRQSRCDRVGGAACGPVEYWVMNGDGSNQRRMCSSRSYSWAIDRDRTSNDGTWRLETAEDQRDIFQIWLGTARRDLIVSNRAVDWGPALTADNWWLAWVTNRNANDEIYIKTIDQRDQNQRRLTVNTWEWDKHPSWSPDGRQIAFYTNRANKLSEATCQIWVMDVVNDRGVNLRNLSRTVDKVDSDPVWFKWDNIPH